MSFHQPFPRLFLANFGPIYCSFSNLFVCRFPTNLIACSIVTNFPLSLSLRSATFFRFLLTIFFSKVRFCFFCQKRTTFSYRLQSKGWPWETSVIIGGGSFFSVNARLMGLRSFGGSLKCYWPGWSLNLGVNGEESRCGEFLRFLDEA